MQAIQNNVLKRIIETNRMYSDVHVFQFQYISEQLNTRFLEQYPAGRFQQIRQKEQKDQKRLGSTTDVRDVNCSRNRHCKL